jgi:hypothetical protein
VPEFPGNLIPKKPIAKPINAYPQLNIETPLIVLWLIIDQ